MRSNLHLLIFCFMLFTFRTAFSQGYYIPEPSGQVVTDYEGLLSETEKQELAAMIKHPYYASSNQLMVICIPTKFLGQLTIEEYSNKFFKKWQPGQPGLNNGVLMIIAGSKVDSVGRKLRFEVGYGLEGALPDVLCKRIQMQLMVPKLKVYQYYDAIASGSMAILEAIKSENKGKTIVFRSKANRTPVLQDEAGILDAKDFEEVEKRLSKMGDGKMLLGQIFAEDAQPRTTKLVNISERSKDDPVFSLFLSVPYTIIASDSTISIENSKEGQGCYFVANIKGGKSDTELEQIKMELQALVDNDQYTAAIKKTVGYYEEDLAGRRIVFYGWILVQFILMAIVVYAFYSARKRLNGASMFYRGSRQAMFIVLFAIISGIVIVPNLITLGIAQYMIWKYYMVISDVEAIVWCTMLTLSYFTGFIYMIKLVGLKERYVSTSSSSYSSDNSSYTSSSSSDYSSSDSSSSSDSNSDYGGGGGDSGGGGASSDW